MNATPWDLSGCVNIGALYALGSRWRSPIYGGSVLYLFGSWLTVQSLADLLFITKIDRLSTIGLRIFNA